MSCCVRQPQCAALRTTLAILCDPPFDGCRPRTHPMHLPSSRYRLRHETAVYAPARDHPKCRIVKRHSLRTGLFGHGMISMGTLVNIAARLHNSGAPPVEPLPITVEETAVHARPGHRGGGRGPGSLFEHESMM